VPAGAIGVMSPYRAQLRALRRALALAAADAADASSGAAAAAAAVEHDTIDRWQGRDKPCMIISLVRAGADASVGEVRRPLCPPLISNEAHSLCAKPCALRFHARGR
jgi:superfamily I DNA and/or RNA helicase